MGEVAGFVVADFLYQHARRSRRTEPVPDAAWAAIIEHHQSEDAVSLAVNAELRGRPQLAEALYRGRADRGDGYAASCLADLLVRQGRRADLRDRATGGDPAAAIRFAALLAEDSRIDEAVGLLYQHNRDRDAANYLVNLLTRQNRLAEATAVLRMREGSGGRPEDGRLATLLARQGRVREMQLYAEDGYAYCLLAETLARDGRLRQLRKLADAGHREAEHELVRLLARRGRVKELRRRAESGNAGAAIQLATLLAGQGRTGEAVTLLRSHVDAGRTGVVPTLVSLLAGLARMEEAVVVLRSHAAAYATGGADRLAKWLTARGQSADAVTVLRVLADAGDWTAKRALADLLVADGRVDELRRICAATDDAYVADRLAASLVARGDVDGAIAVLRGAANLSSYYSPMTLVALLAEHHRVEDLTEQAKAGHWDAVHRLVGLLAWQGRTDDAIAVLKDHLATIHAAADERADEQLARLLTEQGRADEAISTLRERAGTGGSSEQHLVKLLVWRGRASEAIALLSAHIEAGSSVAAVRLVELLARLGYAKELQAEVNAGTPGAVEALAALPQRQRGAARRAGNRPAGTREFARH